jgi:predicted ABC-type exoprotein transport system permease subunit
VDVATFYALFSTTCFALVGLWWNVVQRHDAWMRVPAMRRAVGGVYLSFFLPAVMGLFAQVGGTTNSAAWRVSFVVVALVGCWSSLRLLQRSRQDPDAGVFARHRWAAAVLYAAIAVIGVAPDAAQGLSITPLQTEAVLLILLVVLAHGLVWEFMTHSKPEQKDMS